MSSIVKDGILYAGYPPIATQSNSGLMSALDKTKIDSVAPVIKLSKLEYEFLSEEDKNKNIIYIVDEDNDEDTIGRIAFRSEVSNPNLLDNTDFSNPVNQREITSSTWAAASFGLDRWRSGSKTVFTSISPVLTFHKTENVDDTGYIYQKIENISSSKIYTFSARINNKIISCADTFSETASEKYHDFEYTKICFQTFADGNKGITIYSPNDNSKSISLEWCKLEEGNIATAWEKPDFRKELDKCQYYFMRLHEDNGGNLVVLTTAALGFNIILPHPMRITPTFGYTNNVYPIIRKNTSSQTGFSFSGARSAGASGSHMYYLYIQGDKTSHGITAADVPTLSYTVDVNAEL